MKPSRFHTKRDFVSEVSSPSGSLLESLESSAPVEDCSIKTVREKPVTQSVYAQHFF